MVSLRTKRILLFSALVIGIIVLFLPVRNDYVTGYYIGDLPDTQTIQPANDVFTASVLINFPGHPAGIAGLILFALLPFLVLWQSFSIKRPFSLPARAFIQLQAMLMFIGGPYFYYMITFRSIAYADTVHTVGLAWGGWILCLQSVLGGILLFTVLLNPEGRIAQLFDKR